MANETRANNAGKIVCRACSIALKRAGRTNPNARYRDLDDHLLDDIDSDEKAYLLGWLASDGSITANTIALFVHGKDRPTLERVRDLVCPSLPLKAKRPSLVGFTINSQAMVRAVCRWLDIVPGKKSSTVGFPRLASPALTWAFVRGFFDGDGSVSSVDAANRRATHGGWPSPRCSITSNSSRFLDELQEFVRIPAHRAKDKVEWSGANALDFLGRIYNHPSSLALTRKRDLYLDWCCWSPALRSSTPPHPLFRWARTLPEAKAPSKNAVSDSGFDLTLVARAHRHGAVEFFRTGIRVQPAFGWYFDLVPRSSISKSGYMLANGVGVIDRGYTGEILVPLIKVDPNAGDLELPSRLVQIIPRPIVAVELVEVDSFDETARGGGGFGSTG